MESLAVKYRPHDWKDVVGQESTVKILSKQVELSEFKNAYLFCGLSGEGKTSLARIFASKINEGLGNPIEIDGASNNGVDNVKAIIKSSNERSIDSKYKIFIIDEAHALTNQAWQAFLKGIEEPPAYTIYIFCTTDPQKIPATILNRVQRFNFSKIPLKGIVNRLELICKQENFLNYSESIEYIAKRSDGGMRNAISMLDKCSSYSKDLSIDNVLKSLGNFSYPTFFEILNGMIDGKTDLVLKVIENYNDAGSDLTMFVNEFLEFLLDVTKYCLFKDLSFLKIPATFKADLDNVVNISDTFKYYKYQCNKFLNLKNIIKNETYVKTIIEINFIQAIRLE